MKSIEFVESKGWQKITDDYLKLLPKYYGWHKGAVEVTINKETKALSFYIASEEIPIDEMEAFVQIAKEGV